MSDHHLWHPFANMARVPAEELTIVSGSGSWVTDDHGRRYLDASASLWYCNIGHGREELAEAAAAQMRRLAAYHTFDVFANPPAQELARRLAHITPTGPGSAVFFTSGGSEAIDTAAKLARRYFTAIGQHERTHLVSRAQGYHGTHGLGTSIGGIPSNREGVGPLDPDSSVVAWDSVEALEAEIERLGANRVAAVFVEPVIGAGGVLQPPAGYVEGVAELCARTGVLFVCDSVIAAFGRLGTWFGAERFGVRPDLLTFAKGVTSGYLPLGGVVVSAKVAAPFWEDGAWFRHGPTYAGHPTVCAAAMANLDIIERESLLDRGRELEDEIGAAFGGLADHPLVGEIRAGIGALAGVGFAREALAEAPDLPARIFAAGRERGVLVRPLGDGVAFSPPLIITREEVEHVAEVLGEALDAVARDVPAAAAAG